MVANTSTKWHVAYTRPKHERLTAKYLDELGIDFLLPMENSIKDYNGRKTRVSLPLFPSYIFVNPKKPQNFYDVLDLNSVVNYVKIGKQVAEVPYKTIENLKILTEAHQKIEQLTGTFKPGNICYITDGAFSGLNCEVVSIGKRNLILVRVDIFQRNLLVELPDTLLL